MDERVWKKKEEENEIIGKEMDCDARSGGTDSLVWAHRPVSLQASRSEPPLIVTGPASTWGQYHAKGTAGLFQVRK